MRRLAGPQRATALGLFILFAAILSACGETSSPPLPALAAQMQETTVSGISSGAYMAGQFQVAHSSIVSGAAIIAGGPYGCAESAFADMMTGPGLEFLNASKAINGCMLNALAMWGVPNPRELAEKTRKLAADGRIDPVENLASDRVYLFSGTNDRTVVPAIVDAAAEYYRLVGVPNENIEEIKRFAAGHGFVTEEQGLACGESGKPYVVDCDYDQAGALLGFLLRPLQPRGAAPNGTLSSFDQRPFTENLENHGLADKGFVYTPESCARGRATCRIHIAFHGCAQSYSAIGDAFIRKTGFARWADTNNFVVLFPQTATGGASNPQGCWDWWGYTGRNYLTRDAPQITAVYRMLERLTSPRA